MTFRHNIAIVIAILLATSGCAQMRSGLSPEKIVRGTNNTHEMHFGMARIAERNGKRESAQKAYLRILEQDSEHVASLHRMAVLSVQANRLDEAIDYFEKAINLSEPDQELLCDYGYALYLEENFEAAEKALIRSQDLAPDNQRVANNLALVLGRQGKYNEAFEMFQQSGGRAQALANLAYVQSQSGDISYAKKNYHNALGLDPKLTVAANGLYEIHQAFPAADSMIIKPFRGDLSQPEQRLAKNAETTDEIDKLIQSISFRKGTRPEPLDRQPVDKQPIVRAAHEVSVESKSPAIEASPPEILVRTKEPTDSMLELVIPERATHIESSRIPSQSRPSSRRADPPSSRRSRSSADKNDSSRK